MKISPFFTIIIPLCNQKDFLRINFKNLVNQKFNKYELILVDDGSTDESYELARDLKGKYPFVKIFHQINKGPGAARNRGIELANGKYICFFDIDDKVKTDWLKKIYDLLIVENPDVLIYSYKEINPNLKTFTVFKFQNKIYRSNDEIRNYYIEDLSGIKFNNGFVWNKVYKREFLIKNNLKFPDLRIQQDEVFNHEVYKYANSLITSSEVLYDYYVYDKGNTRNSYIPDRLKIFEEVKKSFSYLSDHWHLDNPDLEYYIHSRFVINAIYNRNPISEETKESYIKNLFQSESLNESVRCLLNNSKGLSLIEKLYLLGIIKKSKSLFLLTDLASQSISHGKSIYRRLFK